MRYLLHELHAKSVGRSAVDGFRARRRAICCAKNETAAMAMGVKRFCIPNPRTKGSERKREQRKRCFRNGQKWRVGYEQHISVVKLRNNLERCHYKGVVGMNRCVGRCHCGQCRQHPSRHGKERGGLSSSTTSDPSTHRFVPAGLRHRAPTTTMP
jgi:hypothetical protein